MAAQRGLRLLGVAGAALSLTLVGCGGGEDAVSSQPSGSAGAAPADQVKVILDYIYNEPFAPIAYGVQQGIFAKNGVELDRGHPRPWR